MMDKKPHIKPYLYGMFAGFGAISLSILFFFLIYRFQGFGNAVSTLTGILMPFIYGSVIAYLLKPVCNWLEAFLHKLFPEKMHRFANMLAVALTILFGLLLIYALIMMIVPQLINSVTALYYTARDNIGDFVEWISKQEFIANNKKLLDFIENSYDSLDANLDAWIKNTLLPSMQNILSGAAVGVVNVVTWIKNFIIGLIVSVYLLASRKKFGQQGKLILYSLVKPRWADLIMEEVRYADRMFGGFINGKILDSAIIGVLCYIACLIFKFPSALLVSVIIGVTNVIPFFGPFIGAIPATLLILIQNPIKALWFVLFVLVLQQVDGNIIGPKILGNTTGLSSFWVLFAILLFGGLWGFVGMIIGVPLFAVIYDVVKKLVIHGLCRNDELEMLGTYHEAFGDPEEDIPAAPEAPARMEPEGPPEYTAADITRELEDGASSFPGLVNEVQRRLGKILSTSDLKSLYTLYDYLALPAEVICLLVSWCVEEFQRKYGPGRKPRMSQIQKEGFVWRRLGVDTAQAAEAHLKKQALYRSREGEILRLLDQPPRPLVEKERKKVAAWTDMGFADEVLRLAYEKTVYKKQKMDWDYMNGILCGWHRKNLHTLAEVEAGDRQRRPAPQPAMQGRPAAPGEADQRVREDLERMREFLRRQQETEGE